LLFSFKVVEDKEEDQCLRGLMGSPLHIQVKTRVYDMVVLMAPRRIAPQALPRARRFPSRLQGRISPWRSLSQVLNKVNSKVNSKASQAKGESH
jgi:hypothetical protein